MRTTANRLIAMSWGATWISLMVSVLLAFILPAPLAAQKRYWKELNARQAKLKDQGKYEEATPVAEEALRVAEKTYGPQHENTALSLANLAFLYLHENKLTQAEPLYQRAITVYEKALGPENKNVAFSMGNLAQLYHKQGKLAEAESLLQRALSINEKVLGPGDRNVAVSLNELGQVRYEQRKYEEAESFCLRALSIFEKALGPEHPDVATALSNLGATYIMRSKFTEAKRVLQRALSIREKTLGPEDPLLAASLFGLALVYLWYEHKLAEAEPLYQRALSIQEKVLGPENPELARTLAHLGSLYSVESKLAEAEPLLQRALRIEEKTLGPESPSLNATLMNLALVYVSEGKYAMAEPLLKRAILNYEKVSGPNDFNLYPPLVGLASLYEAEGKFSEAEGVLQRTMTIWPAEEKNLSPLAPPLAARLGMLAELYRSEGKYAEAEPLYQRALQNNDKDLGPNHDANECYLLNGLAGVFTEEGKYAEAEPLYQRCLNISEKASGTDLNPSSLAGLAAAYGGQGRYTEAEPLLNRALDLAQKAFGPESEGVASLLHRLAGLNVAQAKPDEARALYARAFDILFSRFQYLFTYMSERERLGFLATVADRYPVYFSFVEQFRGARPQLTADMYNLLLWEKGLIARSETTLRSQVMTSGDAEALKLLDRLAAKRTQLAALTGTQPSDLDERRRQIQSMMTEANDLVMPSSASPSTLTEAANREEWRKQIERTENEATELEKALVARSSIFDQQRNRERVSWQQVRDALRPDEAAVEFARFDFFDGEKKTGTSHYAALVVTTETRDNPAYVSLGEGTALEEASLAEFQQGLRTRGMKLETTAVEQVALPGARAYQLVWKHLQSLLASKTRIYLSADGVLNQMSLGLIPTPSGKLLMEEYDLRFVSSTKDLLQPPPSTASNAALVVGNPRFLLTEAEQRAAVTELGRPEEKHAAEPMPGRPVLSAETPLQDVRSRGLNTRGGCNPPPGGVLCPLPGTSSEVITVAGLLRKQNWKVSLYQGSTALEEVVKAAQRPRVVHIATHGFFLSDQQFQPQNRLNEKASNGLQDPMLRSGLLFAGADRALKQEPALEGIENGVLTAYEAGNLNLQGTELVVLSACETGLGENRAGEGVFGLRRAFQEAGAEAVLMSLWSVPDEETKELMELFYTHWLNGEEKHAALRAAELDERERVKKRYGRDLPYYWGAFVLVGR